jgi:pSer/pThr/pTyr-binding forkhead associated (FHA) protein
MAERILMGQLGGPLAWVVVVHGPDEPQLYKLEGENLLGRDADCQIRLSDPKVSGHHSSIRFEHGQFVVHDLASRNRTYVNGETVGAPLGLVDGDVVRLGNSELVFKRAR